MGDGIQNKYALIINGDTEPRHLQNVERAIQALRSEASYQIAVASPTKPQGAVEHFVPPDPKDLEFLIQGMKSRIDNDDLLVVYVTGYGGRGVKGTSGDILQFGAMQFGGLTIGNELILTRLNTVSEKEVIFISNENDEWRYLNRKEGRSVFFPRMPEALNALGSAYRRVLEAAAQEIH